MSVTRQHAEWLSLIEVSGPFLSMPVLLKAFPQGLDKASNESDIRRTLRSAYEEWAENNTKKTPDSSIHYSWIHFILEDILDFPADMIAENQDIPQTLKAVIPEHGVTLRPQLVIKNPAPGDDSGKPRILVMVFPHNQELEKTLKGEKRWSASPATRMMELLRSTGVRLGIVTNGEHWMLVHAPQGETSSFVSWYSHLWLEEPLTFRAFMVLLGIRCFTSGDEKSLEALFAKSAEDQQDVTDQLGDQVRKAVEVLVRTLDRADLDKKRILLKDVPPDKIYQAALRRDTWWRPFRSKK